jgi:hypothetical protein
MGESSEQQSLLMQYVQSVSDRIIRLGLMDVDTKSSTYFCNVLDQSSRFVPGVAKG